MGILNASLKSKRDLKVDLRDFEGKGSIILVFKEGEFNNGVGRGILFNWTSVVF